MIYPYKVHMFYPQPAWHNFIRSLIKIIDIQRNPLVVSASPEARNTILFFKERQHLSIENNTLFKVTLPKSYQINCDQMEHIPYVVDIVRYLKRSNS